MDSLFGPRSKGNRSASMQLSINAIVILVMAMAVLGLGLGLIRGVLGSGKDKLLGSLDSMDLTEQATAQKPITNINSIKMKRNSENTVAIGFYNKDTTACATGAQLNITCEGLEWTEGTPTVLDVNVAQGEAKKLGGIFTTNAAAKNYPCKIEVQCVDEDGTSEIAESESAFVQITA